MRIWSLHPKYLDPQGLVALWRETLLAQAVLRGETKGYKNHPQLQRFKDLDLNLDSNLDYPQNIHAKNAIAKYLESVWIEATARGYSFDKNKIGIIHITPLPITMTVTEGQIAYEWQHLLKKLQHRSPTMYQQWMPSHKAPCIIPEPHPLLTLVPGAVQAWEKQ